MVAILNYTALELNPSKILPISNTDIDKGEATRIAETMWNALDSSDGIGLAAPQIGINRQMIVMRKADGQIYTLLNPTWTRIGNRTHRIEEGCLSIPNLWHHNYRYTTINVLYKTLFKEDRKDNFVDRDAFIVQHECEHLEGRLFLESANIDFDSLQGDARHVVLWIRKRRQELGIGF